MTHQEKLAFIRGKVIEAVPEIVELKFGCVIQMTGTKQPDYIKTPVPITSVKPMSDGCWEVPWGCFHPVRNKKEYIVIGRPIRLADVLIIVCYGANKAITDTQILGAISYWDLRKDDLNEQDEAAINFIHSIIL